LSLLDISGEQYQAMQSELKHAGGVIFSKEL
jgi:hypothetical protein